MGDDESDADNAEKKARNLPPGEGLAEEHRRQYGRKDGIGANDQRSKTCGDRL